MSIHVDTGRRLPLTAAASTTAAARPSAGVRDWRHWRRTYVQLLIGLDAAAMAAGALVGLQNRFGTTHVTSGGLAYGYVVLLLVPAWVAVMALSRCYESRALGVGSDEFRRVSNAAVRTAALVAVVAYATKFDVARGFVVVALPIAALLTLFFRYVARQALHRVRARGAANQRVLVIGSGEPASQLIRTLQKQPYAGLQVLGLCMPGGRREDMLAEVDVPVFGSLSNFPEAMRRADADTVVVAHSPGITPTVLKSIAWELEGTGVDLIVAPALTNVAGPRITVRPVAGLPLLHIDEPELSGVNRVIKSCVDKAGAALLLAAVSPVLLVCALAVKLTSRGPLLFTQTRVGRAGAEHRARPVDGQPDDSGDGNQRTDHHGHTGRSDRPQHDGDDHDSPSAVDRRHRDSQPARHKQRDSGPDPDPARHDRHRTDGVSYGDWFHAGHTDRVQSDPATGQPNLHGAGQEPGLQRAREEPYLRGAGQGPNRGGHMSDGWEKDPDAAINFQFNWASWLGPGETIAAATVVAETGLTVSNVGHDTTTVTFRASGGTTSTRYKVTCHVTSSAGEQDDWTKSILVRET